MRPAPPSQRTAILALLAAQTAVCFGGALGAAVQGDAGSVLLMVLGLGIAAGLIILRAHELNAWRAQLSAAEVIAGRDPLTGLFNRRAMQTAIDAALTAKRGAALIYLDVDRFKQVNDRFGHAAGDEALRNAAQRIRSMIRTEDAAARWGGDEFVVLMPGMNDPRLAAALCRRFETGCVDFVKGETPRVQLSAGYALSRDGDDADALLARADEKLRRRKQMRTLRDEPAGAVLELGGHANS